MAPYVEAVLGQEYSQLMLQVGGPRGRGGGLEYSQLMLEVGGPGGEGGQELS